MSRESTSYTGRRGEERAFEFLKKKKYRIIGTNFRTRFGEIDAIAKKDGYIVFVEIKARMTSSLGPPFLSVTRDKKRRLIRNALFYLSMKGLSDSSWRIDIVSVWLNSSYGAEKIELIENAVEENN